MTDEGEKKSYKMYQSKKKKEDKWCIAEEEGERKMWWPAAGELLCNMLPFSQYATDASMCQSMTFYHDVTVMSWGKT